MTTYADLCKKYEAPLCSKGSYHCRLARTMRTLWTMPEMHIDGLGTFISCLHKHLRLEIANSPTKTAFFLKLFHVENGEISAKWPEFDPGECLCSNTHPKESIALKVLPYVAMYPTLAKAAKACGYALAVHGSMARDMDLIAVPWVEGAVSAAALVEELRSACGGWIHAPETKRDPTHKPHGRLGWTIHLGGALDSAEPMAYIDLAVMPLVVLFKGWSGGSLDSGDGEK